MAANTPRILTPQIDKMEPGVYRAEASAHGVPVADESMHSSLAEAIREEALAVPDGFAHFMEGRFCGLSSGTISLSELPSQAEKVANRLVALLADMHLIAEGGG